MFKSKNNRYRIVIVTILLGLVIFFGQNFIKSVYAANTNKTNFIANALNNLIDQSEGGEIDNIFDGKISVENLYKQALENKEKEELKTTTKTLDQIQFRLPQGLQSDGNIKSDLLNVLYDSNRKIRREVKKTSYKNIKGQKPEKFEISPEDIESSYIKLAVSLCSKDASSSNKITKDQRDCVKKRINSHYEILSENTDNIQQFGSETFGEDLFINGSIEDSSYDLVNDINRIGNLLFNSFKAPVQTLFYKFPTVPGGNNSNNNSTNSTNQPTTPLELLQAILKGNTGNNSAVTYKTGSTIVNNNTLKNITTVIPGTSGTSGISGDNNISNETEIQDSEIQTLINNTSSPTTQGNGIAQGNSCITSIPSEQQETTENEYIPTEEEKEAYISGLNDFIQNTWLQQENQNVLNITQQIAGTGNTQTGLETAVTNIINEMFDQGQAESCLEKCADLDYDDKIICEIECVCFSVSYPQYTEPELENWNDSLKLRFCTIPVQAKSVSVGKDINSFDEMLTRIQAVFTNLLNGGEMVTYKKTKEYLDNPIADLKRSEIFSFNIEVKFKSLFANKSKKTLEEKEANQTKKTQSNVGGKNENPIIDINKYVIIKDIKKTKANISSSATTLDGIIADLEKAKKEAEQLKVTQTTNPNIIKNQKNALINGVWGDFLSKNSIFWNDMTKLIAEINNQANILKNKPYNPTN